ncbi:transcriptional regulator SlyA [compost metagenome]
MIAYIHKHQGRGVIQKELADRFHVGGANITSILQGLEKKGFIERKIPAHNERQKNIYVLPKGVELIEEFKRSFQQVEAEIVQSLSSDEQKLLKELLVKINQNF